ncbi:hypothetical protein [Marivita sp. GX14005]|uniref:hypothetical protein n=1 Tax=Marivita sp. GX14005 TaxID=2942276 RepID=UPI00201976D9|nr:hypothetical protein [Marivita sp. GX14005]MCL3880743.1 hypothetical protein [Marivita sp. GX14005]
MSDTDKLERAAETHRAQLADRLSGLASSLNPDPYARKAVGEAADMGQMITHSVVRGAKRNPAGFALIGIGAALVALNSARTPQRSAGPVRPGAPKPSETTGGNFDERVARADALMQRRERAASGRFAQSPSASSLRKSLDKGLDRLSPEARARVTKARLKAIEAQEKLETHARRASARAQEAHSSQPFLTGAIAAGIGAVIGSLLPSTRFEADLMGETRDRMMRDAEAVLRDEIAAVEQRGKAAIESGIAEARSEFSQPPGSSV